MAPRIAHRRDVVRGRGRGGGGGSASTTADQNFAAASVKGFTASANFSTAGNNAFPLAAGDCIFGTISLDVILPGGLASVAFNTTSSTQGWSIVTSGGSLQISVYPSTNALVLGQLKKGLNRFFFFFDGTNLHGSLNGAAATPVAAGSFTQPDSGSTFTTGGSIFSSSEIPGRLFDLGHIPASKLVGGLTDAQLQAAAQSALPNPGLNQPPTLAWYAVNGADYAGIPGGAGRFFTPKSWTSLCDVYFQPGTQWAGGSSASVTTAGSSPKTWTVNTPATLAIDTTMAETLVQNVGPKFVDTAPPSNASGLLKTNPQARLVFTLASGFPDVAFGLVNNDALIGGTGAEPCGLYVGASGATIESDAEYFTDLPPSSPTGDGNTRAYWQTIEAASGVTPSSHPVWFYNGAQEVHSGVVYGGYLQWIVVPTGTSFAVSTPGKIWIYDGDSIVGGMGSGGSPPRYGLVARKRRNFPTTGGPGAVVYQGYAGRRLYDDHGAFAARAAAGVAAIQRSGCTTASWAIELVVNDYLGTNADGTNPPQSAAAFGSDLQSYVNAIQSACTSAGITVTICIVLAVQSHWDSIANSLGDTMSAFRSQQSAITGATIVDPRTPNAVSLGADNIHPVFGSTGEGNYALNVDAVAN